ncbi:MAG: FtsX-like permease family protein [Firmicutes bacterium]|nr:FtsX-like permease family protein [Bacillota bacterium]
MSMILKVASRNILRQKKRSFLLAGAIAFGMFVITMINALTGGVVENIRVNFSHALGGHIFVSGREYTDHGSVIQRIRNEDQLTALLEENGAVIESVTKRSQALPTLIFGSKQTMHLVYGVDFEEEEKLLESLVVTDGSLANVSRHNSLILPGPIGDRLGVQPGETILVRLETLTGQQNVGEFMVEAFIEDQERFGLSAAYANRDYLNSLIGLGEDEYQSLNMFLTDMDEIDKLGATFRTALGVPAERDQSKFQEISEDEAMETFLSNVRTEDITPWEGTRYRVTTLNQIMEPVEAMVYVLNKVGLIIFVILLVITAVGITNTFRMILVERTKEIGTMRAFGMQQETVKYIFLMEALLLSLAGGVAGVGVTAIVAFVLGKIEFTTLPAMQFFLNQGHITFSISLGSVVLNLVIVLVMSLIAAYWPARAAAKLSPIKALSSHA